MTTILREEFASGAVVELQMDDEKFYVFHYPSQDAVLTKPTYTADRGGYGMEQALRVYNECVTECYAHITKDID
ncbi:hypothetical protein vBPpSSYP_2 [Pseudomonas phage vB_PpS_SYP]|nr:hypothetical protein vBPpSSYP_2 [Pseudomonas phage vB_PpS_SYP]